MSIDSDREEFEPLPDGAPRTRSNQGGDESSAKRI